MTFTTETRWTPSGKVCHEVELMKQNMPLFRRLYALKHLLPIHDQDYIEAQSKRCEETGTIGNIPHFANYARERLEFIAKKQAKCKGVSL